MYVLVNFDYCYVAVFISMTCVNAFSKTVNTITPHISGIACLRALKHIYVSACIIFDNWRPFHGSMPVSSELSLITLHWFLTLFASVVHMKVLLRLWDLFFYSGSLAIFQITMGMLKLKVRSVWQWYS